MMDEPLIFEAVTPDEAVGAVVTFLFKRAEVLFKQAKATESPNDGFHWRSIAHEVKALAFQIDKGVVVAPGQEVPSDA